MTADGPREFDFTSTIRLAVAGLAVFVVAVLGAAAWRQTQQLSWFEVAGAVVIAIGTVVCARFLWSRLVRRATLDDHRLRVVTAGGREQVIDRADIVVRGLARGGSPDALARLRHPGGELYLLQPPGADLVDLLLATGADR